MELKDLLKFIEVEDKRLKNITASTLIKKK